MARLALPTKKNVPIEIIRALCRLFHVHAGAFRCHEASKVTGYDYLVSGKGWHFSVLYREVVDSTELASAISHAKSNSIYMHFPDAAPVRALPLIVTPFMGSAAQELCDCSKLAWLDLSGNVNIWANKCIYSISCFPDRFSELHARSRIPWVFEPKRSRVIRHLLLEPRKFQTVAALSRALGVTYFDVQLWSVVWQLEWQGFLEVNAHGAVRLRKPMPILKTWRAAYDFSRHRVVRGNVPAESANELLHRIARTLSMEKVTYAITGQAAAWCFSEIDIPDHVTVYLKSWPSSKALDRLGFSASDCGGNLSLVVPDDEQVFHGRQEYALRNDQGADRLWCVHPIQAYLDLKEQPGADRNAVAKLCRELFNSTNDDK